MGILAERTFFEVNAVARQDTFQIVQCADGVLQRTMRFSGVELALGIIEFKRRGRSARYGAVAGSIFALPTAQQRHLAVADAG